jgi:hypothetical protein
VCRDGLICAGGQTSPERVETVLTACLCQLTEESTVTGALQAVLPGIAPTSKIAIKVNCIGQCATRWEVPRALCSCLSKLFEETYDVSQVTIYDQNHLAGAGYTEMRFAFDGSSVHLLDTPPFGSGIYPAPGHELTDLITQANFLIDMPVLKDHNSNELTSSLKNHYGSVDPQGGMCGDVEAMLELNTHPQIKDKTALVVLDGIMGVWHGGPQGSPRYWSTYADGTPNTLFVSTDPVTVEYWGRDVINTERAYHGLDTYEGSYIEAASLPPYELGVSDPGQMDVRSLHLAAEEMPDSQPTAVALSPYPNPTASCTTFRFRLAREAVTTISIYDPAGRRIAIVSGGRMKPGRHQLTWDGQDSRGQRAAPGLYRWVLAGQEWETMGSVLVVK